MLASSLVGLALAQTVKDVVHRAWPDVRWTPAGLRPTTPSFPSGHSLNSMASYGALALLLSRRLRRPWQRALLSSCGLLLCVLIGVSRMYLGVHYLTDVAAGWCAGLACVTDGLLGRLPLVVHRAGRAGPGGTAVFGLGGRQRYVNTRTEK